MALSPGIITNELSFVETTPTVAQTLPVIVGGATKGPVGTPRLLNRETDLIREFGTPVADDYGLLAAVEYLKQGTSMFYLRVADSSVLTATVEVPGPEGTAATGSVAFSGLPNDGDNVVISDGVNPALVFEFDRPVAATGSLTFSVGIPLATETIILDDGVNAATTFEFDDADFAIGTLVLAGQPDDGDQFVVNDGVNPAVTFEFDDNASVVETSALRRVIIGGGVGDTLNNLAAAINNTGFTFAVTALSVTGGDTVNLQNDNLGIAGNVAIAEPVNVSTNLSSTGMAGGADLTAGPGNVAVRIGVDAEETLDNFLAALTAVSASTLNITGVKSSATLLDLTNGASGIAGNVAILNGAANVTETGMSGGTNSGVGAGNVAVAVGTTAAITAANLRTAINLQSLFDVAALPGTTATVNLTNTIANGTAGNVAITETDTAGVLALAGMSGGAVQGAIVGMTISAASPGTWGNAVQVVIRPTQISGGTGFDLDVVAPVGTSGAVQVVETFFNLSTTVGNARYIETLINTGVVNQSNPSNYIRVAVAVDQTPISATYSVGTTVAGADGISGLAAADYIGTSTGTSATGLQALRNAESVAFNLLAIPGVSINTVIDEAINVCEARQDALYVIDPPIGLTVQGMADWHNGLSTVPDAPTSQLDTSYATLYWSWPTTASEYLQTSVALPPSGFVLAQYAKTDREISPWRAPAGLQRGTISALSVEFSPDETQRNILLGGTNAVNPIVSFTGLGIQLYGNETLQRTPGPTDAIHIRRGMIDLKRLAINATRTIQFEPNGPLTWRAVEQQLQPLLDFLVGIQAIEPGAKAVCNADTNPPELQAQKTLNAKIFLKPRGAAETLVLDFVIEAIGAGTLSLTT
jgi:uncharacterized protein